MSSVVDRYYLGYEGEPEIDIIRKCEEIEVIALRIWVGFFENILSAVKPENTGWTSLAYYYNLDIGWYEESPWLLKDIESAITQLKGIDVNKLSNEEINVLIELIKIFENDIETGEDILIEYD